MRLPLVALISLTMLAALLPASPAAAACPSSGGASVPQAADPNGDVVFRGHGFGHGLGMSQYGANGAAKLGCSHEEILERYYSGANLTSDTGSNEVVVGIIDPRHQSSASAGIEVIATSSPDLGAREIQWRVDGCGTAANCANQPPPQAKGEVRQVIPDGQGRFRIYKVVNGTRQSTPLWTGGQAGARLAVLHEGTVITVRPLIDNKVVNQRTVRWGQLELLTTGSTATAGVATSYVRQRVTPGQDVSGTARYQGLDRYLWGLGEVPSTFELAAQRAQAVAARTYALRKIKSGFDSRCKCHLVTTQTDQHYTGWSKESEDLRFGRRWRDQVLSTQREVMTYNGSLISALYSSSHGGHSEHPSYVWGTSNPGYLTPIDDSNWDRATDQTNWKNPYRSWAVGFSWTQLAAKLGFDRVTDITVGSPIGSPSRHSGVTVSGVKGGRNVQESWTGWDVRQALGLRSPNFVIDVVEDLSKNGIPITGDWDGNGTDDLGWYRDGDVALRLPGGVVKRFRYGTTGDIPIIGDFNGDGIDTVSIIRDREWHINNRPQAGGAADKTFIYGRITAGDKPLAGDWNGDGVDGVGIVRRGEWHLRNDVGGGTGQVVFTYGRVLAGDIPVTGDWLGRGSDQVGIVRGTEWHLRYELAGGAADRVFTYGDARLGDYPVTGDFDANRSDTTGIVRGQVWYLRNDLRGGSAQITTRFKG